MGGAVSNRIESQRKKFSRLRQSADISSASRGALHFVSQLVRNVAVDKGTAMEDFKEDMIVDYLRGWAKEYAMDIVAQRDRLRAENERLRSALEQIRDENWAPKLTEIA